MKKWQQFVSHEDVEIEKKLSKIHRIEKKALDTVHSMIYMNMGEDYEQNKEIVVFGALARCDMCLKSIMYLTNAGYIGSANALFRQVYEYLIWTKITIDTYDENNLKRLHDGFYDFSMDGRAEKLTKLFSKIHYKSSTLTPEYIKQVGKDAFNQFAFYTHASTYSQQCPVPTDDFYLRIYNCYSEIAMWILCCMELIRQHFARCIKPWLESGGDIERWRMLAAYNYCMELVLKQEYNIKEIFPGIETVEIYRCFREATWEY